MWMKSARVEAWRGVAPAPFNCLHQLAEGARRLYDAGMRAREQEQVQDQEVSLRALLPSLL